MAPSNEALKLTRGPRGLAPEQRFELLLRARSIIERRVQLNAVLN